MQEHVFKHFSSMDHNGFLNDVSITFINKEDPSAPLKREDYWRRTLKSMAPFGLNIEDSFYSVIMVIKWDILAEYPLNKETITKNCFREVIWGFYGLVFDYFFLL